MTASKKLRIIALVCERSVDFKDKLDGHKNLLEAPNVNVIQLPCSGQIQPIMIETALKNGADGVITTGCRIGDCHYREGNKFLRERLLGERQPKLKPTVDRNRVRAYWLSALEYPRFHEMADTFHEDLSNYTPPAAPAKPAAKQPAVTTEAVEG